MLGVNTVAWVCMAAQCFSTYSSPKLQAPSAGLWIVCLDSGWSSVSVMFYLDCLLVAPQCLALLCALASVVNLHCNLLFCIVSSQFDTVCYMNVWVCCRLLPVHVDSQLVGFTIRAVPRFCSLSCYSLSRCLSSCCLFSCCSLLCCSRKRWL